MIRSGWQRPTSLAVYSNCTGGPICTEYDLLTGLWPARGVRR
jgi:hypothetical protein